MIPLPRKLTFQLTPLLDLLLIVIFAQYMDIRETSAVQQSGLERELATTNAALEDSHRALELLQAALAAAEEQAREAEARDARLQAAQDTMAELRRERTALKEEFELAREQRDRIGKLVADLFNVPQEVLRDVLAAPSAARSPAEQAELRSRIEDLSRRRAPAVVKHLLTYDELRKRSDIWEIYIRENGIFVLTAGDVEKEFRAGDADEFARNVYAAYKSLPQPKSLVIILLSYGDTRFGPRTAAMRGLPPAIDRMRADSSGRSRFEYAVLGYQPESQE